MKCAGGGGDLAESESGGWYRTGGGMVRSNIEAGRWQEDILEQREIRMSKSTIK